MSKENEVTRDQLGERVFEGIYGVLVDNKLNIDPLANELGDTIDTFVEVVLDYSESNEEEEVSYNYAEDGLCNDQQTPDNICGQ